MQTRSKPQPTSRIGRRPAPAPQGRFKRHVPAKPSTSDRAMSALTGMVGGGAAKQGGRSSAKGGGGRAGKMALLAGGLGLAMKNREKLLGMIGRRGSNDSAASPPPTPGV
jgi:hypothetical protein